MQKEIIVFQTSDSTKLEVIYEDGTVWLTQAQMAELFQRDRSIITKHIKNIFKESGLEEKSNVRFLHIANSDKPVKCFSFDVIVSVGNRVKFSGVNQFKNWAEDVIKARNSSLMIPDNSIRNLIKIIRNQQVMLDKDVAMLFGVDTRALNQAVRRNIERFPDDFMFQLTKEEFEEWRLEENWKSQIVTSNSIVMGARKLPYAFTEHGISMLSGVLHSPTAIEANIRIMRAFVGMRHFINGNAKLFQRIETIEYNQLEMAQSQKRIEFEQNEIRNHQQNSDQKIEEIFQRLDEGRTNPKDGIFFDGQVFDAYVFISDLIKKAKSEIILIDNYVDESVLNVFSKRNENVNAIIYTARISQQFQLDLERYNSQYQPITVNTFNRSHDRFLIIDDEVYHIGASLKDLGKKWFAFSLLHFTKELLLENICN